jgi:hypothetical protein
MFTGVVIEVLRAGYVGGQDDCVSEDADVAGLGGKLEEKQLEYLRRQLASCPGR